MADIKTMTVMEAIRKRPTIYVGDLQDKELPVNLLGEVLCTSVSAAYDGKVTKIGILLMGDGKAMAWDNGPSWDLTVPPKPRMSADDWPDYTVADLHMTQLYACRDAKDPARRSICQHGVVVTNALCSNFDLEIRQNGKTWKQVYEQGVPQKPLGEVIGETTRTGVDIYLQLDPTIVGSLDFDLDLMVEWCKKVGGPEFHITKGNDKVVVPKSV